MARLYDSPAWRRLRAAKRAASPLCEACQAAGLVRAAECVDHIIPVAQGGKPLPDLDGLRSLCWPCHNAKTSSVDQGQTIARHVQGFDAHGNPLDAQDPWHAAPVIDGGGVNHWKGSGPSPAAPLRSDLLSDHGKKIVAHKKLIPVSVDQKGFPTTLFALPKRPRT